MIHSFLLIGQSNAAGRGFENEVEPIKNDGLLVLRNGRWRPMYVPVNPDRETAGISFVESFADLYAKEKGVKVGIIPCADGGSCLDMWAVGGLLFDHACYMAELASRTSTIVGVLWHQGESDCEEERYPFYKEKLSVILNAFRQRLGLTDVPFLLGELGDFLKDRLQRPEQANYVHINKALKELANELPLTGLVPSKGLGSNPDKLHFSAAAQREFGKRYYAEFLKLEDKNRSFTERSTDDSRLKTNLEAL